MKSRFILSRFFYFSSLLSVLLCFSCGDTEDGQETINAINNTFFNETDEQWLRPTDEDWDKLKDAEQWLQLTDEDWEKLKDEDWEKLKGEDWIRLTDAEVEELMNLEIPRRNGEQIAWEKAMKHLQARRFQEFGDIPPVRYKVEFQRQYWKEEGEFVIVTLEFAKQRLAYWAANYFLFPNVENQRTLEEARDGLRIIAEREELRLLEQLRIENPEVWAKGIYAFLIKKHGKIPEVNTIANFLRKLELNLPITDKECHAYFQVYDALYDDINTASAYEFYALLEALHQVRPFVEDPPSRTLEQYREARAESTPFYDIDWDDD